MLAVAVASVVHFWFKDENFHHELAMQHCIEKLDWQGVLDEAARQKSEPTRAIVMMKNLALARLGRQGTDLYLYKNGSKDYAAPFGMRTMLAVGPLIYYHYGLLNYSARLCTEMGVEFGWRAEHLKTLAKFTAITGEEVPLAADSICVHGDNPSAVEFVKNIRAKLIEEGVTIAPICEIV